MKLHRKNATAKDVVRENVAIAAYRFSNVSFVG
jgi:hypothetical protein